MATVSFRGVEGQAAAITGTFGHPIYSLDRCAYVPLGDLVPGERVRAADGWAMVARFGRRVEREDGGATGRPEPGVMM
jgi:hypothetical protein